MISKIIKFLLIITMANLLSACLGGTVAQQIARSIATSIADKAVANALDVDEDAAPRKRQSRTLEDTVPDDKWIALTTARFAPADHSQQQVVSEPEEVDLVIAKTNPLVRVELYNLLIAEEKNAVFEKARSLGSLNLPQRREWSYWHVATGKANGGEEMITFLIPPHFGKLPSGSVAVVEIAPQGDLNVARYTVN